MPVITLYEVFKKVMRTHGEDTALQVAAQMQQGRLIPVDESLVLDAARLALPLADSLIYTTAQQHRPRRQGAGQRHQQADLAGVARAHGKTRTGAGRG